MFRRVLLCRKVREAGNAVCARELLELSQLCGCFRKQEKCLRF